MRGILLRSIGALAALLIMSAAQASLVTWTLKDVTFDDGGTATGSYVYDADTSTLSSVAIVTTAGSSFGGASYTFENPSFVGFGPGAAVVISDIIGDLSSETWFALALTSGMTNAGGTIPVDTSGFFSAFHEFSCPAASCTPGGSPGLRRMTDGSVSTVPIPAAVWLFGSALGLLGWMRRKAN